MEYSYHQPNPPSYTLPPPTHHDSVGLTHHQQFYHPLPVQQQPPPSLDWAQEQERRAVDAFKTKLARSKRKLARQRSLYNKAASNSSVGSGGAGGGNQVDQRSFVRGSRSGKSAALLFDFITPDNKRLRLVLTKVLKKSDVSGLGRIVLPKRDTEENLPFLHDKEGLVLVIRDVFSTKQWAVKFKFWANNKSRMYVLENAGEFVKENGIETGDCLNLYEDEVNNLYYTFEKATKPEEAQPPAGIVGGNNNGYYQTYQAREEEDASLAVLIEQLEHRENAEEEVARSLLGLHNAPPANNAQNYGLGNNVNP